MQTLSTLALSLILFVPAVRAQEGDASSALRPVPRTDAGILARQDEVLRRAREAESAPVIFLGDSITQGWEGAGRDVWERDFAPLGALNLGVSGDRTEHVLWRLGEAPLTHLAPEAIVVLIGTNDLGHGSANAEQTLAGVQAIVAVLREQAPEATVLLLEIFPRGERLHAMRGDIAQINQVLRAHPGERVRTLPIGDRWVRSDGTISKEVMPDFLHLSPLGYRQWSEGLLPALREVLASASR